MRKLIAAAIAAVSLSAFASWERVGSLQVADMSTQGAAVAKVGSFIGNPLAAAGMAAAIADNSLIKFFGPMREKTPMSFAIFLDGDRMSASPAESLDSLEFAVLYPVASAKEEFIRRHEGAAETNGVVVVKGDLFDEDDSDSTTYVVFSEDGKWAGASDKLDQAKLALGEIAATSRSMDGDVARLRIDEKAFKAISAAVKSAKAKSAKDVNPDILASIESAKSLSLGLRVSDLGIDVRMAMQFAKDSESDKCGLKPLGQAPLAFAGKDAIYADAQAEGAGSAGQLTEECWAQVISAFKKNGLDVLKFVTLGKTEKGLRLVFDLSAICKAAKEPNGGPFAKFDADGFLKAAQEIKSSKKFTADTPAYALAAAVKGFVPQWPVAERFAATLPEAASKKPYAVSFFSVSSIVKALAAESSAFIPEGQRAMMKPVIDQLAVETKCGCATMFWRQGDAQRVFFRISADECRIFGSLFTAAMMFGMEGDSADESCGDDDDED